MAYRFYRVREYRARTSCAYVRVYIYILSERRARREQEKRQREKKKKQTFQRFYKRNDYSAPRPSCLWPKTGFSWSDDARRLELASEKSYRGEKNDYYRHARFINGDVIRRDNGRRQI